MQFSNKGSRHLSRTFYNDPLWSFMQYTLRSSYIREAPADAGIADNFKQEQNHAHILTGSFPVHTEQRHQFIRKIKRNHQDEVHNPSIYCARSFNIF